MKNTTASSQTSGALDNVGSYKVDWLNHTNLAELALIVQKMESSGMEKDFHLQPFMMHGLLHSFSKMNTKVYKCDTSFGPWGFIINTYGGIMETMMSKDSSGKPLWEREYIDEVIHLAEYFNALYGKNWAAQSQLICFVGTVHTYTRYQSQDLALIYKRLLRAEMKHVSAIVKKAGGQEEVEAEFAALTHFYHKFHKGRSSDVPMTYDMIKRLWDNYVKYGSSIDFKVPN